MMALLSTESEYYAMTHAIKEGLWFHLFLKLHISPFLSLFLSFVTIKALLLSSNLNQYPHAQNISMFDITSFRNMVLSQQHGFPQKI